MCIFVIVYQDSKKRVVFKRQKYHCVYEYPREAADGDADAHALSPAPYLPDFSTYSGKCSYLFKSKTSFAPL